jgi:hypothetical protein
MIRKLFLLLSSQERTYAIDTPGQYEGETALHIAIVNRDFDMVSREQTKNQAGQRCLAHHLKLIILGLLSLHLWIIEPPHYYGSHVLPCTGQAPYPNK